MLLRFLKIIYNGIYGGMGLVLFNVSRYCSNRLNIITNTNMKRINNEVKGLILNDSLQSTFQDKPLTSFLDYLYST